MIAYHTEAPNGEVIPYSNGFRNKQDAEKWLNNFKAKTANRQHKEPSVVLLCIISM